MPPTALNRGVRGRRISNRASLKDEDDSSSGSPKPLELKKQHSSKYSVADAVTLKAMFKRFDSDNSGSLSFAEFRAAMGDSGQMSEQLMGNSGWDVMEKSAAQIMNAIDLNKDQLVSFQELLGLFFPLATRRELAILDTESEKSFAPAAQQHQEEVYLTAVQREEILSIYKMWDRNGNGSIDCEELEFAMIEAGFGKEEVDEIFAQFDDDHNGELDEEEFVRAMGACYVSGGIMPLTDISVKSYPVAL
jgi:Ca2+-binding EF-hand superfamily protein